MRVYLICATVRECVSYIAQANHCVRNHNVWSVSLTHSVASLLAQSLVVSQRMSSKYAFAHPLGLMRIV